MGCAVDDSGGARGGTRPSGGGPLAQAAAGHRGREWSPYRRRFEYLRARFRIDADLDRQPGAGRSPRRHGLDGRLPGDLARGSRGFVDHAAPLRAAARLAAGSARTRSEDRRESGEPLRAVHIAGELLRARRDSDGKPAVGRGGPTLHRALDGQLGNRRFRRSEDADPLAGAARRRVHRLESLACARPGRPRSRESLQRVEPSFSQCAVPIRARRAGVFGVASRDRARQSARVRGAFESAARSAARRLCRGGAAQIRDPGAVVRGISCSSSNARNRTGDGVSRVSSRPAAGCCRCTRISTRWIVIFARLEAWPRGG